MKTKAVRLYGVNDLRLEEIDLPEIKDDEILASVVTDSICMSSHKAVVQGAAHKRVPDDVDKNPVIIGHEFSGVLLKVGAKWKDKYNEGDKYAIQPAMGIEGSLAAPGYSYKYIGGDSTYVIIPNEVMENNCLLSFTGDSFFKASLAEPVSCVIAGFHENYHSRYSDHTHIMGIKEGGATIILAGAGPMGLGAVDYAVHGPRKPRLLVVTDIDQARLDRAASLMTVEDAENNGVKLMYVNTANTADPIAYLKGFSQEGYDDVFVYAPVKPVVEQGDALLAYNGCLNFFAGPTKTDFSAMMNFYDVHYSFHRLTGTSGGNTNDMQEALDLASKNFINPAIMITHVGGLDSVIDTTLNLPAIKGGKKLVYTHINMPMTAIEDFAELGKSDMFFKDLADICARNNGLWSAEAESYVLKNKAN